MYNGFTEIDLYLAAILALAVVFIVIIRKVISKVIPLLQQEVKSAFIKPPSQQVTYGALLRRLPLAILMLGLMFYIMNWFDVGPDAKWILAFGAVGISFPFAVLFYHRRIVPLWASFSPAFTVHFTSAAPGYQPLRTLGYRHRGDIAALIVVALAVMILIARLAEWIEPSQPIFYGVPMNDYFSEWVGIISNFDTFKAQDEMESRNRLFGLDKSRLLGLAEVIAIMITYSSMLLFFVFPFANRAMRLLPSFNIRLTFIDHFGILAASALGIYIGYLIPLF